MKTQRCNRCQEEKPLTEFSVYADKRRPDVPPKPMKVCKPCRSKRTQAWIKRNPQRHRENMAAYYDRAKKEIQRERKLALYDLTGAEYDELMHSGKCWICGDSGAQLHIDHDHETGRVRGALCRPCNYGLGNFRDDPAILRIALHYLEEPWQPKPQPRKRLRKPPSKPRQQQKS